MQRVFFVGNQWLNATSNPGRQSRNRFHIHSLLTFPETRQSARCSAQVHIPKSGSNSNNRLEFVLISYCTLTRVTKIIVDFALAGCNTSVYSSDSNGIRRVMPPEWQLLNRRHVWIGAQFCPVCEAMCLRKRKARNMRKASTPYLYIKDEVYWFRRVVPRVRTHCS